MMWDDEVTGQEATLDRAVKAMREMTVPDGPPSQRIAAVLEAGAAESSDGLQTEMIRAVRDHDLSPTGWRRVNRRVFIAASMAAVFLLGVSVSMVVTRPSSAWAQTIEAVQGKPWIHAKGRTTDGEGMELWLSAQHGIMANRFGQSVLFLDQRLKVKYDYNAAEETLYRLPAGEDDVSGFGAYSALFRVLAGAEEKPQLPANSFQLISQEKRTVKEGEKNRFEHRFKCQDRRLCADKFDMVFRGDTAIRLPDSWRIEIPGLGSGKATVAELVLDYPRKGPMDVYALGVPKTAELVDRVPADDLMRLVEGVKAGRQRFDSYSAIVVESDPTEHWTHSRNIHRVWRSGNRWRDEWSVDPYVAFKLRTQEPPAEGATPAQWWMEKAKRLRYAPQFLSDGKDGYQFRIKYTGSAGTAEDGTENRIKYEIQSVDKDGRGLALDDPMPRRNEMFPEFMGRPPMGIPSTVFEPRIEAKPTDGPANTVLLEVRYTGPDSRVPQLYRYWIDPRRDYLVMRWDMVKQAGADASTSSYVINDVAQSPQGHWYPTEIRRVTLRLQDGIRGDDLFRYYLDFDAPIPDSLFQPK